VEWWPWTGSYLVGDGSLLVQLRAPLLSTETKAQRRPMWMTCGSDEDEEQDTLVARVEVLPLGGPLTGYGSRHMSAPGMQ
jgi:hypothetical protein